MKKKAKTYVAAPEVPEASEARYRAVLAVLSGELTVSEAARRLEMPRNHFQTLMHRALGGMLRELQPHAPGRPAKPEQQALLEKQVTKLERENQRLRERVETVDRLLGVAGEMIRGQKRTTRPRAQRTKSATPTKEEEEEAVDRRALFHRLRACGLRDLEIARVMRVTPATVARWRDATARVPSRRRARALSVDAIRYAEARVRETRGLIGAASLARAVGVSRRAASRIKNATLSAMERERRSRMNRVHVTEPGVMRGFDAMHVKMAAGRAYLLTAGDASVARRTRIEAVPVYDAAHVARALDQDFATHGAPLVVRLDRASVHRTLEVRRVCRRHRVLMLHGPPRHPRYYGQLERQNREHRAWLRASPPVVDIDALRAESECMRHALNELLPRRTLDWQTAEQRWNTRLSWTHRRSAFRSIVALRLREERRAALGLRVDLDLLRRRAIERALIDCGLLRIEPGGRC